MAEQFLDRGGIELIDALEILSMNAAGHEQQIDPKATLHCQAFPVVST